MQLPSQAFEAFLDQVGGISVEQVAYLAPHFEKRLYDCEQLTRPSRSWVRKCVTWGYQRIAKIPGLQKVTCPWQIPQPVAPVVVHLGDPGVPCITAQEAQVAEQWLKARWLNLRRSSTTSFLRSETRKQLDGRYPPEVIDLAVYEQLCETSIPLALLRQRGPVATTWAPFVQENCAQLITRANERPSEFRAVAKQHAAYANDDGVDVAFDRFGNAYKLRTATNSVGRVLLFEHDDVPGRESLPKDFTDSRRLMAMCEVVKKLDYPLKPECYESVYKAFVSDDFVRNAEVEKIFPFWMPVPLASRLLTPWADRTDWIQALRRKSGKCEVCWSSLAVIFLRAAQEFQVRNPLGQILQDGEPIWIYFGAGFSARQIMILIMLASKFLQHIEIW
jgi:hypothetical protein